MSERRTLLDAFCFDQTTSPDREPPAGDCPLIPSRGICNAPSVNDLMQTPSPTLAASDSVSNSVLSRLAFVAKFPPLWMAPASEVLSLLHSNPFPSTFRGTNGCGALRAGLTWRSSCLRTTGGMAAHGAKPNWERLRARSIDRWFRSAPSRPSETHVNCWPAGPHKTCLNRRPCLRHCSHRRKTDLRAREAEP